MGLMLMLLNLVNTTGEYILGSIAKEAASHTIAAGLSGGLTEGELIGQFYSKYFTYVNVLGLLLQMFVVSAVFRLLGVGRALFIHPFIAGAGYLMMLRTPSFDTMRLLKTADNAVDYSIGNTTKQALWLPTTRQEKYKAKQAVDSFCVRAGDVIQAGVVYMGELASLAIPAFAAINLAMTAAWLVTVSALNRRLQAQADATGGKL